MPNGERDVICAMYNSDNDTLVMTFTSGSNGINENAGVFTRKSGKTAPKIPTDDETPAQNPKFPALEKNTAPKFSVPSQTPSQAPSFPAPSQVPSQAPNFLKPEQTNSTNPKFPVPEQQSSTGQQMPQQFPQMPNVNFSQQTPSLEGIWGAIVNGQQWVLQYQGNQYYGCG